MADSGKSRVHYGDFAALPALSMNRNHGQALFCPSVKTAVPSVKKVIQYCPGRIITEVQS